jgi:Zn-dependent protease
VNDSVRLGRIAGVGIGLNWSLLLIAGLISAELAGNRLPIDAPGYSTGAYDAAGAVTAAGLLLGVLLHELGHAVAAKRYRLRVDGITLSWMGGVTRIEGFAPNPRVELVVAAIGPVVSAAFGGLLWAARAGASIAGAGRLVVAALGWLAVINVVLAGFNLLPASPLDGGRVLHGAVWAATGDRWRATRAAAATGMVLGFATVAAGFLATMSSNGLALNGLFISFLGWWLLASARAERAAGALHNSLDGVRIADVMRPVGAAPGWITARTFVERYAAGRPGWVWLLEGWDAAGNQAGSYAGVLLGDTLSAVPLPQWDLLRPLDVAMPISAAIPASPDEDALEVLARSSGKQVILVVDGQHTLGAVLPADIEALARVGRRPVPYAGWTLTRG